MSIFSEILEGKIKGEVIYRDKFCFVILTIQPASPGHLLIIPIDQIDHFDDVEDEVYSHLFLVAKKFSKILKEIYGKKRIRLIIDGFGVAHTHIHLIPVNQGFEEDVQDIIEGRAKKELSFATDDELAIEALKIREHLNKEKDNNVKANKNTDIVKVFCDGGSRGNPGPAASGAVILNSSDEVMLSLNKFIGISTNNQAEYLSVILAIENLDKFNPKTIDFYLDSLLVVQQLNGNYKVKSEELLKHYQFIKEWQKTMNNKNVKVSFTHVLRAKNKLADEQVNISLDNNT